MGTKIEWATRVWNPVTGCTKGCKYCYARRFAERMKKHPNAAIAKKYRNGFSPTVHLDVIFYPNTWKNPERVFVVSMGDLFDPDFSIAPFWNMMFEMAHNPQHTFMLLTKQPEIMLKYAKHWCNFDGMQLMRENIWCGVSVSNQQEANKLIPVLLEVPASVRFVSIEPMTGPVILTKGGNDFHHNYLTGNLHVAGMNEPTITAKLDWVICGGMTGPGSTPMHPGWILCLRDHCKRHNTPFFFKGWGDWTISDDSGKKLKSSRFKWVDFTNGDLCNALDPFPEKNETHHHELMCRVVRKAAGRLIDGQEYNEFPKF